MPNRTLWLLGLAIVSQAGCQSYFPYGYGGAGAYPSMAPGTYAPSNGASVSPGRGTSPSTYLPGNASTGAPGKLSETAPLSNKSSSGKDSKLVPKYGDPGNPPATPGRQDDDDDDGDTIKRPSGNRQKSGAAIKNLTDDSDDATAALGNEDFVEPIAYQPPSALVDSERTLRRASKSQPNPYGFDRNHNWLKGIVHRDPKNNSWRITYSRNPLEDDVHRGSLALIEDDVLDNLIDDDVVYVVGRVEDSVTDRYGKPSYRVDKLTRLRPKKVD